MSGLDHRLTLLGTGSSGGVPRVGGDWGICDPNEVRNRRMRCSALLDRMGTNGAMTRVLIDTSPDLREQLLAANVRALDALVYTHDHADQTHGIDDVRALVNMMRKPIPTHMDAVTRQSLATRFQYCFEGMGGYPPILQTMPDIIPYQPFTISGAGGDITLLPVDMEHGRIRCCGFRIGGLAYCNDVNELPEESLEHLSGLDVLVVDALRYTPHPSHANLEKALGWIAELKPARSVLTNMHVDLDYKTLQRELPVGVEPGYDGMEIPFSA
ncbi:MBL fold metallo-hydrolase [Hyphomonas oceanitis]|uniref:Metallo-beta-lactamase family protein n=1 Tax=Hyphomonas oceanitis SCH89 TaxID=1280953 RepID=A0A059G5R2_9PROT|nr:MBL fold metallo-hydrolase [Hyphomonas oceanitis]KDA02069.1 metallo-beta-lactamase family protein [Hyphomonas oceanitis SCH89]